MDLSRYKEVRLFLDGKGRILKSRPPKLPEYVSKAFLNMIEADAFVCYGTGFNKVVDIKARNNREVYFVQD